MANKTLTIENCTMTIKVCEEKNKIDFSISEGGREIYGEEGTELEWAHMAWLLFEFTRRLNEREMKGWHSHKPYRAWIPLPMQRHSEYRKKSKQQIQEEQATASANARTQNRINLEVGA